MAIASNDSYGSYLDTGTNTLVTPRANAEAELHEAGEIDTGSKLTIQQQSTAHSPHRASGSPR